MLVVAELVHEERHRVVGLERHPRRRHPLRHGRGEGQVPRGRSASRDVQAEEFVSIVSIDELRPTVGKLFELRTHWAVYKMKWFRLYSTLADRPKTSESGEKRAECGIDTSGIDSIYQ